MLDITAELRIVLDRGLLAAEYDVAHDARQQIVEVMCDASGEMPQCFHFLSLPHCLLGMLALRDLAGECEYAPLTGDHGRSEHHFVPMQAAILSAAMPFESRGLAGLGLEQPL